jgi:hypothetical protein
MTLLASAIALSALVLVSGCGDGKAVATINKKKNTLKEYEQQAKLLQSLYQGQALDATARRQVLEQMVKQELLVQEAEKAGLAAKPEVKQLIEQQRVQYKGGLETQIANLKLQLSQIDNAVRSRVLIETLLKEKGASSPVTDKEAKEFFNRMKQQGATNRPFEQERPRIEQQILLDRLVGQAKEKAEIDVQMDLVTAQGPEAQPAAGSVQIPPQAPK